MFNQVEPQSKNCTLFQFNRKSSGPADTCEAVPLIRAKSHQTRSVAPQTIKSETSLISIVLDLYNLIP